MQKVTNSELNHKNSIETSEFINKNNYVHFYKIIRNHQCFLCRLRLDGRWHTAETHSKHASGLLS